MKIVVALLTCDRLDLTKKTVKSFLKHNDRSNFEIFYGDDASTDPEVHKFLKRQEIPCLMKHKKRAGCSPSSDELIHLASDASDAPYILYLQNDLECARPIPLNIVQQIFDTYPRVGWIRLYGLNKNAIIPGGNPTDPHNRFKPGKPIVKWEKLKLSGEQIEIGDAQWSFQPAIHRAGVLRQLVKGAVRERDAGMVAAKSGLLTARFMKNITNHMGIRKTTPGGKFGKPHDQYEKPK